MNAISRQARAADHLRRWGSTVLDCAGSDKTRELLAALGRSHHQRVEVRPRRGPQDGRARWLSQADGIDWVL